MSDWSSEGGHLSMQGLVSEGTYIVTAPRGVVTCRCASASMSSVKGGLD